MPTCSRAELRRPTPRPAKSPNQRWLAWCSIRTFPHMPAYAMVAAPREHAQPSCVDRKAAPRF